MPPREARLKFQADFKLAAERNDDHISAIKKGDAEDEFTFVFSHPNLPKPSHVEIRVHPQDVQGYPDQNTFLVYTNDDTLPIVAHVLEESISEAAGMKVQDMLSNISRRLRAVLERDGSEEEDTDIDMTDDAVLSDSSEGDVPFEYGDDLDDELFGDGTGKKNRPHLQFEPDAPLAPLLLQRIRRDLRSVLKAGFHVGKICGFEDGIYESMISISIRVTKLCLSKETHEAWGLSSSDFIVLLIKFDRYYTTIEDVLQSQAGHARAKFRLRRCSKKKPSYQQAIAAFRTEATANDVSQDPELHTFWVSKSIDEFMNADFAPMLKLRKERGVSWDVAKEIKRMHEMKSFSGLQPSSKGVEAAEHEEESINKAQLPPILANDHMLSDGEVSLPLVAIQFALRYLVRCTDYCTVCHRRMKGNFEALRPYVCNEPLCLHQYMNIGFGPDVDHEVLSQPKVVDLLVSFCYTSLFDSLTAGNPVMREFPTGLNLQVPKILGAYTSARSNQDPLALSSKRQLSGNATPRIVPVHGGKLIDPLDVIFNLADSTATIISKLDGVTIKEGQWVIISTEVPASLEMETKPMTVLHHVRIVYKYGVSLQLEIMVQHTLPHYNTSELLGFGLVDGQTIRSHIGDIVPGHLIFCDADLDDIQSVHDKAFSMLIILTTFPSVADMKQYLMDNKQLFKWNRMPRAAVDLLRWIMASNRSYIVQVDDECPTDAGAVPHPEKIYGVDGWIQFRFAQGSLEKENRFNEVLKSINKPQKTLVAWHGSKLGNWHSIIRQGLNYNVTANGRSYGDGIYFARQFDASFGYTGTNTKSSVIWPNSSLRIRAVVSLNELVNLPEQFQSNNPFFVIQHCHWTQCRYLFVRPTSAADRNDSGNAAGILARQARPLANLQSSHISEKAPPGVSEFIQDPKWRILGPWNKIMFIPRCAIPSAQYRCNTSTVSLVDNIGGPENPEMVSSDEDEEDILFLSPKEGVSYKDQIYKTDFRPGTLDFATLPQLAPPSYATKAAQRALGQEIKKLEKVQSTTPLHELGWYIDFEKINNMFQWIVELHSFDSDLPLAQDMKVAGLTSIVLEIRFLREFPMSPPFVRVVRPRFLPFSSGGGGHVTAGGAMCMELLTNTGWSPANSLENVLLQVRLAICNTDPNPARLLNIKQSRMDYSIFEALEAYIRAANTHGWDVPKDLREASASRFA
ncbi:hypothetical protein F4813DRAFT_397473 [Daldinia decipiens]|uniref:uncharacterized protein n=1 Tax=Daldinia decipiens TaxID=326647 RepID=UPI0020C4431A|nr:uncharacterized protein F4813DRAFT_397473 [Daldinia decipiens]KAI1656602.1 hypothetical protein F4813DRAFT_397473 [Daldinia decipiens]